MVAHASLGHRLPVVPTDPEPEDKTERCGTCKYHRFDECHASPPTVRGGHVARSYTERVNNFGKAPDFNNHGVWPSVSDYAWCGTWTAKAAVKP